VDWADAERAVWVADEQGQRVSASMVRYSAVGFSEWGRQLDEWRAQGIVLWAAIERPDGRVLDFLLDHGVRVYPVNPKALDRARDRFRQSGAKDDLFDARVLAGFLRTDHAHLMVLEPSSEAAQELKLLTEDYQRQVRNAAGESVDGNAEGLLSSSVGGGGTDDRPSARLPAAVSDPGHADDADRASGSGGARRTT